MRVKVRKHGRIALRDSDFDDANAVIRSTGKNINKGNLQIGHGINRVLRPLDL